jgi:uncharacterized protein YndB with AHSA1/START domain
VNNQYHFITRWRLESPPERVFELIRKPLDFPRWWGSVYLEVEQIEPGDKDSVGARASLHTKGRLPYTLRWNSEVTACRPPEYLALRATGDFEGRGVWTLRRDARFTDVTFDWELTAEKPLLRYLSFLLRPLFEWNHQWAMEQGRIGFERELKRAGEPPV